MSKTRYFVGVTCSSDFPVRTDIVTQVLADVAEVVEEEVPFRPLTREEEEQVAARLIRYDGLLVRSGIFTAAMLTALLKARIIAVHGAGVDQIDVAAAERCGIYVTNTPGANANAVIELTISLMIDVLRRVSQAAGAVRRDGRWGTARYVGGELTGRTLGLIGVGRIGRGVASRARAFGMDVCGFDPLLSAAAFEQADVRPYASVEELLANADIVSLHLPLEPGTYHLMNAARLGMMRPGSFLINTARGALLDEGALMEALTSRRLGGAALDVLEAEPPLPNHPLLSFENVLVTPHLGGSTGEALAEIARRAGNDIGRVLGGLTPAHPVNRPTDRGRQEEVK